MIPHFLKNLSKGAVNHPEKHKPSGKLPVPEAERNMAHLRLS